MTGLKIPVLGCALIASVALWAILISGGNTTLRDVDQPSDPDHTFVPINSNFSFIPDSTSTRTNGHTPTPHQVKPQARNASEPIEFDSKSLDRKNRTLIFGGKPARKENNYGFFVNFEGYGMCGGSLIAPMVVLTAGHCWKANMEQLSIGPIYESETGESDSRSRKRRIGRIAEYRIHPDYSSANTFDNDFLLIRLSSIETVEREDDNEKRPENYVPGAWRDDIDIAHSTQRNEGGTKFGTRNRRHLQNEEYNDGNHDDQGGSNDENNISYIRLNSNPSIPVDYSPLNVIGMGYVNSMDEAKYLQHIEDETFQKIPDSVCNGRNSYNGRVSNDNMFCAGTMKGGMDACMGDSGGPLFYYDNGDPVQVGVVSWGSGCGLPNLPSVYGRVSNAYEWIQNVVCGDWKNKILSKTENDNDDWFLCKDYDDRQQWDQIDGTLQNGGHAKNYLEDFRCDRSTEVSLEFKLTADAYGWEVSWELLSNNNGSDNISKSGSTNRVAGDQLFNDHETRIYQFCLPRGGQRDEEPKKSVNGDDGGSELVEGDLHSGEGVDIKNSDTKELNNSIKDDGNAYNPLTSRTDCYTLNIRDRMSDGMALEARFGSSGDSRASDDEILATNKHTTFDPAGFGIHFGTAQSYDDFSFPDFGDVATFILCPASTDVSGETIENSQEDMIYVVTEAPSQQPTMAPSDLPTTFPPLRDYIPTKQKLEQFNVGLRGRTKKDHESRSSSTQRAKNWLQDGWQNRRG